MSRWTSQPGLTAVSRPFSLSGADTLKLDIPAENILIMGGAATYRIKIEKKPQDIVLHQCDYLQVALPDGKVKNSHKKIAP